MEGVTLGMAYGLRRMKLLGVNPGTIRVTGGGSKSAVWRQICADVFGHPVVAMRSAEGAALGAAIQALATAQGQPVASLATKLSPVDEATHVTPRSDFDYTALLERQDQLREKIFTT